MIDKFNTLNFIGDQTIEAKLNDLRAQLNGSKTAKDFKDETARQALREAAEAVAKQAAENATFFLKESARCSAN